MALSLELEERFEGNGGQAFHRYAIFDDDEEIGQLKLMTDNDHIEVQSLIFLNLDFEDIRPGPRKLRELLRLVKQKFPRARSIGGFRISGARLTTDPDKFDKTTEMSI